ncbi:hypothetical protein J3A64_001806 [Pseudarthrobacter sp. PvP004]|nr:hypothetical protein [Pseudarthrobacter sp. PvP004]
MSGSVKLIDKQAAPAFEINAEKQQRPRSFLTTAQV